VPEFFYKCLYVDSHGVTAVSDEVFSRLLVNLAIPDVKVFQGKILFKFHFDQMFRVWKRVSDMRVEQTSSYDRAFFHWVFYSTNLYPLHSLPNSVVEKPFRTAPDIRETVK
jgi:hypothetical protein